MRRDLTRVIRRVRPDIVVTGDPTVRFYGNEYMNHPDHRAVADAALDAIFPSSETSAIFPELLAEGLDRHKVKQVFLSGARRPGRVTWTSPARSRPSAARSRPTARRWARASGSISS